MTKEELFKELLNKIVIGEISREELLTQLSSVIPSTTNTPVITAVKTPSSFSVTKFLYGLGAIIAIVGILLFVTQIWNDIGSMGRIIITLGLGTLLTIVGAALIKAKPGQNIGPVFCVIGGILIPGGAFVTLSEFFGLSLITAGYVASMFGLIFVFYLLLDFVYKNVVLTFFTIAHATIFIYALVNKMTAGLFTDYTNLYAYLTLAVAASYIMLGYSFRNGWNEGLSRVLYAFGFVGIQAALIYQYSGSSHYMSYGGYTHNLWPLTFSLALVIAFYVILNRSAKNVALTLLTIINSTAFVYVLVGALLGDSIYQSGEIYQYLTMVIGASYFFIAHSFRDSWNARLSELLNLSGAIGLFGAAFSEIFDSVPWQMFYPILVIAGFAYSIYARSRSVLIVSTISLLAYVSFITSEYFADSLGWPISLVILGFLFIGLGYMSVNINKKYIKQ